MTGITASWRGGRRKAARRIAREWEDGMLVLDMAMLRMMPQVLWVLTSRAWELVDAACGVVPSVTRGL